MTKALQLVQYVGSRWLARAAAPLARSWAPYSHLLVARDYAGWTLDVEAQAVMQICRRLRVPVASGAWTTACRNQAVFHVDQFVLLDPPDWGTHRVGIAYYHGVPGSGLPVRLAALRILASRTPGSPDRATRRALTCS